MTNAPKLKQLFTILNRSYLYRSTARRWILITGVFLLYFGVFIEGKAFAETKKSLDKRLFKGTMTQTAPIEWSGPFELFLRYDSENSPPQPLDGLTIWPTLGGAKVKIKGTWKSESDFEFEETGCVSTDCSQIVMGGRYKAKLDLKSSTLNGTATGPVGLKGTFSATRFRPTTD